MQIKFVFKLFNKINTFMPMKQRLNASQDHLNIQKEALFCIRQTQKNIESQKNQKHLNKLSLDYILPQSSKQKFFAKLIPLTARLYPQTFNKGIRLTNTQYSSARVRKHKKQFLQSKRYQQNPQKNEQMKRYTKILSLRKKRQQQGGIDSFWMFKKQKREQEVKKFKVDAQNSHQIQQPQINKTQAAYKRVLMWGKQSQDGLIPKNLLKNYIASKLGQNFASWFLNFYQFRAYITYKQFQQAGQRFKNMKIRESHVVTFFLYDNNGDSFICPKDIFGVFERQLNLKIQRDVLKLAQFVKNNNNRKQGTDQEFKIQHLIIRDDWLTIKDYQMYFKKVDEPYLKATSKKDTVFSKTFAVLDHRQKIRSVRKQMNQKKNMYDQLYGQITKRRKSYAFVEKEDYKLNFSFLHQVFKGQQSELFKYFCDFVFNI